MLFNALLNKINSFSCCTISIRFYSKQCAWLSTVFYFLLTLEFNVQPVYSKTSLLCKSNHPAVCAAEIAKSAVSMYGLGAALELCESDPAQCRLAMMTDIAVLGTFSVPYLAEFVATAVGGLVGLGSLAATPVGGPFIILGAGMVVFTTVKGGHMAGKSLYCQNLCTPKLAKQTAIPFQNLIKGQPSQNLTHMISAITKSIKAAKNPKAVVPVTTDAPNRLAEAIQTTDITHTEISSLTHTHDPIQQQNLLNASWCIKYCPAKYNMKFMCHMLDGMSLQTEDPDKIMTTADVEQRESDIDSIVKFGKFLVLNGTSGGFHHYLGPENIENSKLGVFVRANKTDTPSFCYKLIGDQAPRERTQLKDKFEILKNIYDSYKQIKQDPYLLCTTHKYMKNGAEGHELIHDDTIEKENSNRIKFYLMLKEKKDPELMRILNLKKSWTKSYWFREQKHCAKIEKYVDEKMHAAQAENKKRRRTAIYITDPEEIAKITRQAKNIANINSHSQENEIPAYRQVFNKFATALRTRKDPQILPQAENMDVAVTTAHNPTAQNQVEFQNQEELSTNSSSDRFSLGTSSRDTLVPTYHNEANITERLTPENESLLDHLESDTTSFGSNRTSDEELTSPRNVFKSWPQEVNTDIE